MLAVAATCSMCCHFALRGCLPFLGMPGGTPARSLVRRRASGFSSDARKQGGESGQGFSSDGGNDEARAKKSKALAKDTSDAKSRELARTKLQDLREKTLAQRAKREAELDEYEEGRALIAKYGPKVARMPEKVAQRTAKRGLVIGGAFYGTMLTVFISAAVIYKTQDIIIPPSLVAFITLGLLATSVLGSSYGMMSAQWDPNKEQSVLGVEEFGDNVKAIGDGFRKATMQQEYEKGIDQRRQKRKLLEYKQKKRELLNK